MSSYTLDDLRKDVADGRIDTVLAAQVDMQGRLMGKRFQAEYFLDSAWKETHSCNYLQATDKNRGKAAFDEKGNVRVKGTTDPWIGGNPFPNPANAQEIVAPLSLSWGRHDQLLFCIKQTQLDGHSNPTYHYEFCWVEIQGTGRTTLPASISLMPPENALSEAMFF